MMMYNKTIKDYFFSPAHVGTVNVQDNHSVVVRNEAKGQGDIELSVRFAADGVIEQVCFRSNGNPYLIASLEWLCRQLQGKPIHRLPQVTYQSLLAALGIPKMHYPVAIRVEELYKVLNDKLR